MDNPPASNGSGINNGSDPQNLTTSAFPDPHPSANPAQNPGNQYDPHHVYTAPHIDNPNQSNHPHGHHFFPSKILIFLLLIILIVSAGLGTYLALNTNVKPKPKPDNPKTSVKPTLTSAPTPTINPIANWKTYNNSNYGFSFMYPPEWTLEEYNSEGGVIQQTLDKNNLSDEISFNYNEIAFSPQPSPPAGMTAYSEITVGGIVGRQTQDNPGGLGRVGGCLRVYQIELPVKNGTLDFSTCVEIKSDLERILKTFKLSNQNPGTGIACTLEAKICPDGSYVGRKPPSCEFAACPE
jgi:hypothetical protein